MQSLTKLVIVVLLLVTSAVQAQDVYLGMPRDELIKTLGSPESSGSLGTKEILKFANGARIILRDGVVRQVEGMAFLSEKQTDTWEDESSNTFKLPEPPGGTSGKKARVVFESEHTRENDEAEQATSEPEFEQEPNLVPEVEASPNEEIALVEKLESEGMPMPDGYEEFNYGEIMDKFEKDLEKIEPSNQFGMVKADFMGQEKSPPQWIIYYGVWMIAHTLIVYGLICIGMNFTGLEFMPLERVGIAAGHAALYYLADIFMIFIVGFPLPDFCHLVGAVGIMGIVPMVFKETPIPKLASLTFLIFAGMIIVKFFFSYALTSWGLGFFAPIGKSLMGF